MPKFVTCECCGMVMSLEVLHNIGATKRGLWAGDPYIDFLCQNCGAENRV